GVTGISYIFDFNIFPSHVWLLAAATAPALRIASDASKRHIRRVAETRRTTYIRWGDVPISDSYRFARISRNDGPVGIACSRPAPTVNIIGDGFVVRSTTD